MRTIVTESALKGSMASDLNLPEGMRTVEWDADRVERFWSFVAANIDHFRPTFAGEQWSPGFLSSMIQHAPRGGDVVEIGFGTGRFLCRVARRAGSYVGVESNPLAVEQAREAFGDLPGVRFEQGTALDLSSLPDDSADTLFIFEVIEHLSSEQLDAFMAEARRVLRPGGRLVATTPNAENLVAGMVGCPDCGSVFHRVQHMQSFDADRLKSLVQGADFSGVRVRASIPTLGKYRASSRMFSKLLPNHCRTLIMDARAPAANA